MTSPISPPNNDQFSVDANGDRKIGVTQLIRQKLNFNDERTWKKFSARRLELIDNLELSSKKASEQDEEIRRVADSLRLEFNYPEYFSSDFDKLVRAAVQSVRRNRKRSSKSRINTNNRFVLVQSTNGLTNSPMSSSMTPQPLIPSVNFGIATDLQLPPPILVQPQSAPTPPSQDIQMADEDSEMSDTGNITKRQRFISEITRLNSDSGEDFESYSRTKKVDSSRLAINSLIAPKIIKQRNGSSVIQPPSALPNGTSSLVLPSISTLTLTASTTPRANNAKNKILSYIERSKTCSESASRHTDNLKTLGESVISTTISFVFEKFFTELNANSIDYLRSKLISQYSLSKLFKSLDNSPDVINLDEVSSCVSLFTLIGGCIKDFGFDCILFPLSEIFHEIILRDYPLISNQIPNSVNTPESTSPAGLMSSSTSKNSSSSSLTSSKDLEIPVLLKFMNSTLDLTFRSINSSPPRLIEIIENGKNAFNIMSDSIKVMNSANGLMLNNDQDVENLFSDNHLNKRIELELSILKFNPIPINQLTAFKSDMNSEFKNNILPPPPPPLPHHSTSSLQLQQLRNPSPQLSGNSTTPFKFLSNTALPAPRLSPNNPPYQLPKFQPLL